MVGLGLDQKHFFCQTIRGISLFWIAIPEIFLLEWNRGEFRITADCAQGNEFFDFMLSSLFH